MTEQIQLFLFLIITFSLGFIGLKGVFKKELYLPTTCSHLIKKYSGSQAVFWGFLFFVAMCLIPNGLFILYVIPNQDVLSLVSFIIALALSPFLGNCIWKMYKRRYRSN